MSSRETYFGLFLVERGLITFEQLMAALIEQSKRFPPRFQIAFENNFFSAEQWREILNLQASKQLDFHAAALQLGYWSDEMTERVHSMANPLEASLGHVLLQSRLVTVSDFNQALDEYLSQKQGSPSTSTQEPPPQPQSSARPSSLPPLLSAEFEEHTSAARIESLKRCVEFLQDSALPVPAAASLIKEIFTGLHTIKGIAALLDLRVCERFLDHIETSVLEPLRLSPSDPIGRTAACDLLKRHLDTLCSLRNSVLTLGSEQNLPEGLRKDLEELMVQNQEAAQEAS